MQKITPFLWYDNQAEAAATLYSSVFKNATIDSISRRPNGEVSSVTFTIEGQAFFALNGGPMFKFNPAFSIYVNCETQSEIDEIWDKLIDPSQPARCGWLTDQFGLCWQLIPPILGRLLGHPNPELAQRAHEAMMQMGKLDISVFEAIEAQFS